VRVPGGNSGVELTIDEGEPNKNLEINGVNLHFSR
jgi:hypothetical protein